MFEKYKKILIIGFGASSLNIRALLSARSSHEKCFYFLDSLDPYFVEESLKKIDSDTAIIFISKSGNTQETNLLLERMKKYNNIFILSSEAKSHMSEIAKDINHTWINYPDVPSGRFALLEKPFLDIVGYGDKIVSAAENVDKAKALNIATKWLDNFANKKRNWVLINYAYQMNGLLLWVRQIISESLGKNGFGITPILAKGSMDEHSQLQLFLDGPDDKFYDLMSTRYYNNKDSFGTFQTDHAFMVEKMLQNNNREVVHICHDYIDDLVIGDYIGTYSEVVKIISNKIGFDPYNQPAVEDIKQKIL